MGLSQVRATARPVEARTLALASVSLCQERLDSSRAGSMRARISVNLHGYGHLTSIAARFETRKCPHLPGETVEKRLQAKERD